MNRRGFLAGLGAAMAIDLAAPRRAYSFLWAPPEPKVFRFSIVVDGMTILTDKSWRRKSWRRVDEIHASWKRSGFLVLRPGESASFEAMAP